MFSHTFRVWHAFLADFAFSRGLPSPLDVLTRALSFFVICSFFSFLLAAVAVHCCEPLLWGRREVEAFPCASQVTDTTSCTKDREDQNAVVRPVRRKFSPKTWLVHDTSTGNTGHENGLSDPLDKLSFSLTPSLSMWASYLP